MRPTKNLFARKAKPRSDAHWFGKPPAKKKYHFCTAFSRDIPGFPLERGIEDPYFMNSGMTGRDRYHKTIDPSRGNTTWEANEEKGIPPMPPNDIYGNRLIPRDEAQKFMPDIYIDGLVDAIDGDILHMGKHIVPHQFHEFFDESLVAESILGSGFRADNSRRRIWKQNHAMYLQRHPLAEEFQRKFLIGDEQANDAFQDPDDKEYEKEIVALLIKGDINEACSRYKRMADPCKNWHIYTMMVRQFASRGLLGDALSVYDEMEISSIPLSFEFISALLDCCISSEHSVRVVWAVGLCHQSRSKTIPLASDEIYCLYSTAIRYLLESDNVLLASRLYSKIKDDKNIMKGADMIAESKQKLLQAQALGIIPESDPSVSSFRHRTAVVESGEWWSAKGEGDISSVRSYQKADVAPFTEREISVLEKELEGETERAPMAYFKKSEPVSLVQKSLLREYNYAGQTTNLPSQQPRDVLGKPSDPMMRATFRWNGNGTRMISKDGKNTVNSVYFDNFL